jgi:hypothetical protein
MSDKKLDGTKATSAKTGASDATKPASMSIAPAMDLSLEAVTVPPPPVSGAVNSAPFSIPRAPRVPSEDKPAAAPAKRKRSEDDIFSIFDVDANTASDDIPVSVQQFEKKPDPVPEKPKSKLGTGMEEREITRSRQIPIDQDLFNLSGLFSSSPQATLGAPDMSALASPGLSDKPAAKPASKSALDDLVLPTSPVAPQNSLDLLAPSAAQEAAKPKSPSSHRTVLFAGIGAALLLVGGVFFYVQNSSPSTEATAPLNPATTSTEAALDTRPGQTIPANEPQPRIAKTDTPQNEPASLTNPAPANGSAAKDVPDKPAQTGTSDKPAGQGKPSEPEATAKAPEPEPPSGPSKAQSLAEAMAAAGKNPPPASGPEFNKGAATAALNGAAGSASGCKAPGDPSGVARVSVTFAPSGRATRAVVSGAPYSGTATGSCVAAAFRSLSVPAFAGDPVTVSKSVSIR